MFCKFDPPAGICEIGEGVLWRGTVLDELISTAAGLAFDSSANRSICAPFANAEPGRPGGGGLRKGKLVCGAVVVLLPGGGERIGTSGAGGAGHR